MSKEKITGSEALMRSLEHEGGKNHLRLSGRSYHAGV